MIKIRMKLIDADSFKLVLRDAWLKISDTYGKNDKYCQCIDKVMIWLNEQPTIQEESEKYSKWNYIDDIYCRCSNCNEKIDYTKMSRNYCPNCGSKMKG